MDILSQNPPLAISIATIGVYLIGFLLQLPGWLGKRAGWVGIGVSVLAAGLGITSYLMIESAAAIEFSWANIGGNALNLGLELNLLSAPLLAMVTLITALVHIYSVVYMAHEHQTARFWSFLSLFAMAMLLVILAKDLLLTFAGWELMGLSSYFLIGFYRTKEQAARGSQKAFIVNRIGDAGFMIAILALWAATHSVQLTHEEHVAVHPWTQTIIGFGLMAAAFGKSAQFPLQGWLPDAMAGPTPVSSLIHAATMVAAGVFLLLKYYFFLLPIHLEVLAWVGGATALMAAISAMSQRDIKRVLAYSTISQLGLMMVAVGVRAPQFAAFHLFTHAFFKCGLFLSAGAVIHLLHEASHKSGLEVDAQDMSWMGGLGKKYPLLAGLFVVFAAALAGLPFFSGFLSKEGILGAVFVWSEREGGLAWLLVAMALVASLLTAFYITRLGMLVFFGKNRFAGLPGKGAFQDAFPKISWGMLLPMLVLAAFSFWLIWSINPFHSKEDSHAPSWFPWAVTGATAFVILLATLKYRHGPAVVGQRGFLFRLSKQHFFLDQVYHGVASVALTFGRWMDWLDHHLVDGVVRSVGDVVVRGGGKVSLSWVSAWADVHVVDRAVTGLADGTQGMGRRLRGMQSGKVQRYLMLSLVGIVLLFTMLYFLFLST